MLPPTMAFGHIFMGLLAVTSSRTTAWQAYALEPTRLGMSGGLGGEASASMSGGFALMVDIMEDPAVPDGISREFWWMGIMATMLGATMTVLGFIVQKGSHKQTAGRQVIYWLEWRWIMGLVIWFLGQILCYAADGLANRSLLACFNCWNIVVVFVLAPFCLGEAIAPQALCGASITVLGCVWVVLAGPKTYYQHTVKSLQDEWISPPFLCVASFSALFAAVLLSSTFCRKSASGPMPVQYAALSAVCAWYATLLSKCSSSLVVTSVHARSQLGYWQFWIFPVGVLVFGVLQMHVLNLALKVGCAVSVLPVYESLSMTGQVILCGIFFNEFRGFNLSQLGLFGLGVACVLAGVATLYSASGPSDHHDEDEPTGCLRGV